MTARGGTAAAAVLALAALAAGCDSVPSTALTSCDQTQVLPGAVKTDILFVVDDSASMDSIQALLASNFSAFASALAASPVKDDFQIGVTTTSVHRYVASGTDHYPDTFAATTACPTPPYTAGTAYPRGALVSVTPVGGGGPAQRVQSTTGTSPPRILAATSPSLVADFTANADVGVCGSGKEQGLEAARLALQAASAGGANDGFLRPGSRLAVVIVSDSDDCSDPGEQGTSTDPTNPTPAPSGVGTVSDCAPYDAQNYVDFFKGSLGGETRSVVVGAIVAVDPITLQPAACTEPGGATAEHASDRYKAFADAFAPHALVDSVCNASFSDTLTRLAGLIAPDSVPLSGAPADWRLLAVGLDKAGAASVSCEVVPSDAPTPADPTHFTIYTPPQQGQPATLTFPKTPGNVCQLETGDQVQIHVVCAG